MSRESGRPVSAVPIYRRGADLLLRFVLPGFCALLALIMLVRGDPEWALVFLAIGAGLVAALLVAHRIGTFTPIAELWREGDHLFGHTHRFYGRGEPVSFALSETGGWRFWGDNALMRLVAPGVNRRHAYIAFTHRGREWRLNFIGEEVADLAELRRISPSAAMGLEGHFRNLRTFGGSPRRGGQ